MFLPLQKLYLISKVRFGLCYAGEGTFTIQTGLCFQVLQSAGQDPTQPDAGVTDSPQQSFWRDAAGLSVVHVAKRNQLTLPTTAR